MDINNSLYKILVVDDIRANVMLLKALLKKSNYQVLEAYNGKEALEVFEREKPDLILLDIMMPIMDGYQVMSTIRNGEQNPDIAIILITALDNKEDVVKGFNAGANDYIANTDLPFIYSGAKAFLYTSLRESFGIPILESMACGCPIITSNTSAIPEVAGSGAILIDPYNIEEIANMIEKVIEDNEFRERTISYGIERVKLFSWENTAKELINLYNSL